MFERIAKKLQKQGYERDWKQSRSKKLKITMEKQEGEERHANSTKNLIEFWDTGQPQFLLPCWTLVILPAPWLNLKRVKKQMVKYAFYERMAYFYMIICVLACKWNPSAGSINCRQCSTHAHAHTHIHTYTILAAPPTKYKKENSKVEKAMEKVWMCL